MPEMPNLPKPPYVPFGTFKSFVERFREQQLPDVIDRSLMGGMSGTVQSMLATALRSMGFVSESNKPTERFQEYLSSSVQSQRDAIASGLRDCYSAIFTHETPLQKMTAGQFDTALRNTYGFTASTLDKAASFFFAACVEIGLDVGPHLQKRRATATRRPRERNGRVDAKEKVVVVGPAAPSPAADQSNRPNSVEKPLPYQLLDLLREDDFAEEHKAAVWQLVQYLMERGKKNTRVE